MTKRWWKEGVIYQIYPRSFKDSNGDGIGDIRGIIDKIDHIAELGIDIVWLGPVYDSPNDDNGYDIRDYYKIHSDFGTMDDFDELLNKLHQRGIKLIMDLVVNHSSDEHEWFEKSRSSRDNPYRDYYFWKDGKNGSPPNNWTSFFGGSAWEWDEETQQYYLHLFTRKQPDLNWENPNVKDEIFKIVKFWCDKGIDGFRLDVIPLISKRLEFADSPHRRFLETVEHMYSNGPKVHDYIHEIYSRVLQNYDVMTVGEGPGISIKTGLDYVHEDRGELSMIFHLDHMFLGYGEKGRFDATPHDFVTFKKLFVDWDKALGDKGWLSIFLDNHDFPRMVSRFGNDKEFRVESAKMLAMLILTLRGTPCIYQGSEIGMTNVVFQEKGDFRDVETLNYFASTSDSTERSVHKANLYGRDNVRTPMQWDQSQNGGFTDGMPWIKVNENFTEINCQTDNESDDSIQTFYKEMLNLRKANPAFIYGHFEAMDVNHERLFRYTRKLENTEFHILLNFSDDPLELDYSEVEFELVKSNYNEQKWDSLSPWEGRILKRI